MPPPNVQTWTRLQRIALRRLAIDLGHETMSMIKKWPSNGDGRAVKDITEKIFRHLDGPQPVKSVRRNYGDLLYVAASLETISLNSFFQAEMANRPMRTAARGSPSMGDLLNSHISEIRNFVADNPAEDEAIDITKKLTEIVPEQKIGPFQFDFFNGVLKMRHAASDPLERDRASAVAARKSIIAQGLWLTENLSNTNVDPKILPLVEELQQKLESEIDIIDLGITNIVSEGVFTNYREELPIAIAGKLSGYSISISMYVAQFPEWIRFSENAAVADYSASDVEALYRSGFDLVDGLKAAGTSVDPEVPRTLKWLLEAIKDPLQTARRTVFAAMRTIENLLIKIFTSAGTILGGFVSGAQSGVKVATSAVVSVGLITLAANMALSVSPAAANILQTKWLKTAAELILKELKEPPV
jgi:hypothetical protein